MSTYGSRSSAEDRSESPDPVDDESQDDRSSQATPGQERGSDPKSTNNAHVIPSVPTLESVRHLRSVAHSNSVCWELSSAKPGNGVEQLRDHSSESYWQSDGTTQPHWIQITFARRLRILYVAMYLDIHLDESYTPRTISIETGMTTHDLTAAPENQAMELHDPVGWCIVPVVTEPGTKIHLIRINILSMHQNGRDTHVRNVAVFAEPMRPVSLLDEVMYDNGVDENNEVPTPLLKDVKASSSGMSMLDSSVFGFQVR